VLVRGDVEIASTVVAEDEVKFERLELPPLEEETDSRERQLGLIEPERRADRGPESTPMGEIDEAEGDEPEAGGAGEDEEV